ITVNRKVTSSDALLTSLGRSIGPKQFWQNGRKGMASARREADILQALSAFREIIGSTKRHLQAVRSGSDLSGAQLWALWEISQRPGIRVGELADRLFIHQSTASNLLDPLQERKLIERERRGADQRIVRVRLTDAGNRALKGAPGPARGILFEAIGELPAKDLVLLNASLRKILRQLRVRDRSAARRPLSDLVA